MRPVERRICVITVLSVFTALFIMGTAAIAWSAPYVQDELLVQMKAGVAKEKFDAVLGELGATTEDEVSQIRV